MSGHSHWHSIRYQKGVADQKRGKIFSKLARIITVAAREKGGDPQSNPTLRMAIEKARSFNMPKENIERAVKKGAGELEDVRLEKIILEAYGPGGAAIIIEGITDNKNRTLGEVKKIINQHNSKLADTGSVQWLFERRGAIVITPTGGDIKEDLELKAIEAGAEDISWDDGSINIYTKVEQLEIVKRNLEEQGAQIDSTSLDWVAKEPIQVSDRDKKSLDNLCEALDENEDVQDIFSNIKA